MNRLFVPLLIFCCYNLSAQPFYFHKQWDKRYGGTNFDGLQTITRTDDGGYILGGGSNSAISGDKSENKNGYWVVKINATGTKQWDKSFGGGGSDGLTALCRTPDKGYLLGGFSTSGLGGDKTQPSRGGYDYWVVKIDSDGNKEWDKRFGGAGDDFLSSLDIGNDNGYILGGRSNSGISGDKTQSNWDSNLLHSDYWVVKIDSLGNKQWDKRFGGTNEETFGFLTHAVDGGFILAGSSSSDSTGDITQSYWGNGIDPEDYWVVKIDSMGTKEWDKRYGGTKGDLLSQVIQTNEVGYILGGRSYSDIGGDKTQNGWGIFSDFWLVKIDVNGVKEWDKSFGGADEDYLYTFVQTTDNGYLLSGNSKSNASGEKSENNLGIDQVWIVKTDSLGNKEWDKTIFSNNWNTGAYAVQSSDSCYVVGLGTSAGIGGYKTQANWDTATVNPTYDYWVVKFCMNRVTGIEDGQQAQDTRQIQVYPNPFTNDLSIALKAGNIHEATFTITNAVGQTIYKREENNLATGYTKMLDLSYLPNGVYFVEVITGGEKIVQQIVKE